MVDRNVPPSVAATLVLLLMVAIMFLAGWLTLTGVLSQWPAILMQIQKGLDNGAAQLKSTGLDPVTIDAGLRSIRQTAGSTISAGLGGMVATLGSAVTTGLSSVFALFFGLFIGATLLYYVLTDFPGIAHWIGRHMGGLPEDIGAGIVEDAVQAMRGYFRANTISGLVVATVIGFTMLLLGIPLALPVALVTFVTVYIPFFGAIVSGAFAFLVALGSAGLTPAIIVLVVILVAQNVIQTIINTRLMGESMNLHPLVVLVATMLGGTFGGLLGAALGAPVAALLVSAGKRLASVDIASLRSDAT
jgi:putative heme transporter